MPASTVDTCDFVSSEVFVCLVYARGGIPPRKRTTINARNNETEHPLICSVKDLSIHDLRCTCLRGKMQKRRRLTYEVAGPDQGNPRETI